MASSSGTISGCSEEDLQKLMDQRKRKRMISNRESARRSRMRKQKHLDELMNQVAELRKENNQFITSMSLVTQNYLNVEAENSVLRAQVAELTHRLQSLNDIIDFMNATGGGISGPPEDPPASSYCYADPLLHDPFMNNSWNNHCPNQLPLMASADLLQY